MIRLAHLVVFFFKVMSLAAVFIKPVPVPSIIVIEQVLVITKQLLQQVLPDLQVSYAVSSTTASAQSIPRYFPNTLMSCLSSSVVSTAQTMLAADHSCGDYFEIPYYF